MLVPNKPMGFPIKNDQILGCEMGGNPPFNRKHPFETNHPPEFPHLKVWNCPYTDSKALLAERSTMDLVAACGDSAGSDGRTLQAIPRAPTMKGFPKNNLLVKVAWGVFQRCVETTLDI